MERSPTRIRSNSRILKNTEDSEFDNGEKNYIKNLTGNPILILTDEICQSGRNKGFPKAIEIRDFKDKKELSEKEINHPQIQRLYAEGKIVDVTKTERDKGMKEVWRRQQALFLFLSYRSRFLHKSYSLLGYCCL